MENFFANLVKQRLVICVFFLLLFIAGVFSFSQIPIDAFPDLANNQVQILTEAPAMAPLETEQLVTIPIEAIMSGLPGVQQIRSTSKYGISVVTVVFNDSVNVYFARQLVLERLTSARNRLPRQVNPQLGPVTTAMGEIYQYVVEGQGYSAMDLKTLHDWEIKYQLRTVPGVTEVNTWGGFTREYVVTVYPQKLMQYGLTLPDVFAALERNNANFGAGVIEHKSEQYIVRGVGRVTKLLDLENIIVAFRSGVPIYVRNIASVSFQPALRQGAVTHDGKGEVVTGLVMMLKGENSRQVIKRIKERIQEIVRTLPEGITIKPFYDQTRLVEQTIDTVATNLIEGGALVVVVLLLMLGSVRAALIVAAVIPLSMLLSFIGMRWLGVTANIMSLGAIDFGMIVDGSIVMVENAVRRLAEEPSSTLSNMEIIQDSVAEMARPILFGVLIITVVYMPILSLQGMEYKMFSPMVFTVCFALLGSLLLALTFVPVVCTFVFRRRTKEKESLIIRLVKPVYIALLDWALAHKAVVVSGAVLAFVAAASSVPFLGTEFVPELDEGDFVIEVRNFPSISLSEASRVATDIENSIKDVPEVKTVVCRSGRPDLATDPMSVYQTDVYCMLKPKSQWRQGMSKDALARQLRERLNSRIVGASFNFTQPIAMRVDELVSGVRSDIAVKIFGDDMNVLERKAAEIRKVMETVPGQVDLQVEKLYGSGALLITPDREKLARYGLNEEDVQDVVETAIMGKAVSEVLEGRKRFDLRVKFPEGSSLKPEEVGNLLIEGGARVRVPLSQVADIQVGQATDVISREFGQRRIIVQCNVANRDIGTFVKEAQDKIARQVKLPPGYYIRWGGQFENQERAMQRLAMVVPLSILIIFLLLAATFGTTRHALLVMLNVPFALIGGVISLWVRGMYLSVPASIGFVALFGVAVLNGLVLVSYINKLADQGLDLETAIRKGACVRLRPVLMTALVGMLGFLPMALSHGAGAEVQKPLATVVIGGLVTSTLLTLVVLPVLYGWFGGSARFSHLKAETPEQ